MSSGLFYALAMAPPALALALLTIAAAPAPDAMTVVVQRTHDRPDIMLGGAISDDGRTALTANDELLFWDLDTQLLIGSLPLRAFSPWNFTLSPDGRYAALTLHKDLCLYDVRRVVLLGCPLLAESGHFSGDGRFLIASTDAGLVRLPLDAWDDASQRVLLPGPGPLELNTQWHADREGRVVWTVDAAGLRRWDFAAPTAGPRTLIAKPESGSQLAMAPDRTHYAVVGFTSIAVFATADDRLVRRFPKNAALGPNCKTSLSNGGRTLVMLCDYALERLDVATGRLLGKGKGHTRNSVEEIFPNGRHALRTTAIVDLQFPDAYAVANLARGVAEQAPDLRFGSDGRPRIFHAASAETLAFDRQVAQTTDDDEKPPDALWFTERPEPRATHSGRPKQTPRRRWTVSSGYSLGLTVYRTGENRPAWMTNAVDEAPSDWVASEDDRHVALFVEDRETVSILALEDGHRVSSFRSALAAKHNRLGMRFISDSVFSVYENRYRDPLVPFVSEFYAVGTGARLAEGWKDLVVCADGTTVVLLAADKGAIARLPTLAVTRELPALAGFPLVACSAGAAEIALAKGSAPTVLDTSSQQQRPSTGAAHTSEILEVQMNERFVWTRGADRLTKIWDRRTGALLASVAISGTDFAIVTPDNYYAVSRTAQRLLAFRREGRALPFAQFDLVFHRPDIVAERLGAPAAVIAGWRAAWERRVRRAGVRPPTPDELPRLPQLTADAAPPSVTDPSVDLRVRARAAAAPLVRYHVTVNGVAEHDRPAFVIDRAAADERTLRVELGHGTFQIEVMVEDERGARSLAHTAMVTRQEERQVDRRNLHILAIGVSDYVDDELDLRFAGKDARDIAAAFKTGNRRFAKVETTVLTDRAVTREAIRKAATKLAAAGVDDVVVLFLAGHGFLDEGDRYFFGTTDIDPLQPAARGFAYAELEELLATTKARRRLVLLDTCHAGEVDREAGELPQLPRGVVLTRGFRPPKATGASAPQGPARRLLGELFADLERGAGATVLASSSGLQLALEDAATGNGLFTAAVLRAVAAANTSGGPVQDLTVAWLRDSVSGTVQELSRGVQRTSVRAENQSDDFHLFSRFP
jgi:hypothetical protein